MASIGKVEGLLRLRNEFSRPLRRAGQDLQSFGGGMRSVHRAVAGFGSALGIAFSSRAVIDFARGSVGALRDLETSLTRINTLVGVNRDLVAGFAEQLAPLAQQTGILQKELSEALFVITSAGERGADALKVLEASAKAAAVGLGETKTVARAVTSIVQAYGKENIGASEAVDILTNTVREGNLEASSLAGSLGRVIGVASQLGVHMADLGAFIATYTRLGVSAEEATTALRAALLQVTKVTKQQEEAALALGLSFEEVRRKIREEGLAQGLMHLADATRQNEIAITEVLPNLRGLAGVLGVTGAQAKEYTRIQESLRDSVGLTDAAHREWSQGMDAAEKRISAAYERLKLATGEYFKETDAGVKGIWERFLVISADLIERINESAAATEKSNKTLGRYQASWLGLIPPLAFVASAIELVNKRFKDLENRPQPIKIDLDHFKKLREELAELTKKASEAGAEIGRSFVPPVSDAAARIAELEGQIKAAQERIEEHLRAIEAIKEKYEAWRESVELINAALRDSPLFRRIAVPPADFGVDMGAVDAWSLEMAEGVYKAFKDGAQRAADEKAARVAEQFGNAMHAALFNAAVRAFDDARGAVVGLASALGQALGSVVAQEIGNAIGGAAGGPIGAIAGGVVGGLIGNLANRVFGSDGPDLVRIFHGAVGVFADAATIFREGSKMLAEAARNLREQFNALSAMLGGPIFPAVFPDAGFGGLGQGGNEGGGSGGPGGDHPEQDPSLLKTGFNLAGLIIPGLEIAIEQIGERFYVFSQIVSGAGDSLEAALRDMMDNFAQLLPMLIEQGKVILDGIPEILQGILKQGAATFDELKENLRTGLIAVRAVLGEVGFAVFQWAADMRTTVAELARLGVDQGAILQTITANFHDFLNSLVGQDLFLQLADVRAIVRDLAERFRAMGLEGRELRQRLNEAREALRLYNQQLKTDVLGSLADLAKQFKVDTELLRKVEIARVKIQFAILRVNLETLNLWEKWKDLFFQVRDAALDAARNIGKAAQEAGRALSGGGGATPTSATPPFSPTTTLTVRVVESVSTFADTFQGLVDALAGRHAPQTFGDQIQSIIAEWKRLTTTFQLGPAGLKKATDAAKKAFRDLIDGVLDSLRAFRKALTFSEAGAGTPGDKARAAFAEFQEVVAAILGGDLSRLGELQGLADLAKQLAQAAFGTSTGAFREIFDEILAGIDAVTGAGFEIDLPGGSVSVTEAQQALQQSVTDQSLMLQGFHEERARQSDQQTRWIVNSLRAIHDTLRARPLAHGV